MHKSNPVKKKKKKSKAHAIAVNCDFEERAIKEWKQEKQSNMGVYSMSRNNGMPVN